MSEITGFELSLELNKTIITLIQGLVGKHHDRQKVSYYQEDWILS